MLDTKNLDDKGGDMEHSPSRWKIIVKLLKFLFWTALVLLIVVQLWKPAQLDAARADVVRRFQEQRKSRVIVLIHGEDTISLFGVPFGRPSREVDIVFDAVGGETLDRSWAVLKPGGRMVTIAADSEGTKDQRVKDAFFIVEPSQKQERWHFDRTNGRRDCHGP
jgi:NADPH:quinone reductase-like Zn-dependent oxidoreductase